MAVVVKHAKTSAVPDIGDPSLVQSSDWNASHSVSGLGTAAEANVGDFEPALPTGGTTSDFLRGDKTWQVPAAGAGGIAEPVSGNNLRANGSWVPGLPLAGGTLTGKLILPAGAAGGAALNIPHGVAPTSPVNGDLWTTTNTIQGRFNGTTRALAITSLDNSFSFVQTFKAGTTGSGSISIPHGVAPTSPVNGEMWSTTAGLFMRINGANVGPFGPTVMAADTTAMQDRIDALEARLTALEAR